jgi:hypothetical protein
MHLRRIIIVIQKDIISDMMMEEQEESTDAEFVRDCWRYLQASEARWARHSRSSGHSLLLEDELLMAVAYERLARARATATDEAAEIIFHVPLREVSDDMWNRFVRRTRPIPPLLPASSSLDV